MKKMTITATPDTSSSLFLVSNEIAADYWSHAENSTSVDGGSGGIQYNYPCKHTLPDFVLGVGDKNVTVPGKVLSYGTAGDHDQCVGGIAGGDAIADSGVFGNIFLKGIFVVFDDDKMRIGFAEGR